MNSSPGSLDQPARAKIRVSLKSKLLLASFLTLALAIGGFCALIIGDYYEESRDHLLSQAAARADLLAANAASALQAGDSHTAEKLLASLRFVPEVMSARLYDPHGRLVASYSRSSDSAGDERLDLRSVQGQRVTADRVESAMPVLAGRDIQGYLVIATDISAFRGAVLAFALQAVMIACIALGIAYLVVERVTRKVLGPALTLARIMRRVSEEKRYDLRARVDHGDEIGDLAAGFNAMIERIADREAALHHELAERREAQRRLDELAHFDPVTKLPNRRYFSQRLDQTVTAAGVTGRAGALMFIDLDDFKLVNDTLGHEAGDSLLLQLGKRLSASLRESDIVCRLGGDEFALVLEGVHDRERLTAVADKLLGALCQPVTVGGREARVGASIGIALFPSDGGDPETLVRLADTAMYRAKSAGKNRYCFFEPGMLGEMHQRLNVETELRRALESGELRLHYQPQAWIADRRIRSFEALLRWEHPVRGLLLPGDFIHVAEENRSLIRAIAEWTLEAACAQLAAWRAQGLVPLPVAVNLSACNLQDQSLAAHLETLLRRYEIPGEWLELEITETMLMEEPHAAARMLNGLRGLGVGVALDDFGTGYSSLAHLRDLPLTALKIDREFVHQAPGKARNAAITEAIIDLAEHLGFETIAEGVESAEQLAFLEAAGCTAFQGFCLSHALSAEEIEAYLARAPRPGTSAAATLVGAP